jgi:hypothetical protein
MLKRYCKDPAIEGFRFRRSMSKTKRRKALRTML